MTTVTTLLLSTLLLTGCQEVESKISHIKSDFVGINRLITLYGVDGKVIRQWQGSFRIEDQGGTIRFLDKGKAVTVSGTFVVEEI